MIRIGSGIDIHKIVSGKKMVIGGEVIQENDGFLAHSDGDLLVHALCDALLGALALGDIGELFPDTDPSFKGADSLNSLLPEVIRIIKEKGFRIENADMTVVMQKPKLLPFKEKIRKNIANITSTDIERISLKATRTEKCFLTPPNEAAIAYATVLLIKD